MDGLGGWGAVREELCRGFLDEYSVGVVVKNNGYKWYSPYVCLFVKPSFYDCLLSHNDLHVLGIVDVHLLVAKNSDAPCFGKFCCADEGVLANVGHDVDVFCRLADVVL